MTFPFLSSEEFDEQAHQLYDAGEHERALELLREGLKRYPGASDLHVGMGYVRIAREEFAWAFRCFEKALALDPEHEDAWVGMGEALLKFGHIDEALRCFSRVDELGLGDDLELGLAMGRALYRESLLSESRRRLLALSKHHPDAAELRAALAYTLHALGEENAARRELKAALRLDPHLHEVRIYLSHLLFEHGDVAGALRELERVPPAEHWDPLSVWRFLELKGSLEGVAEEHPTLAPWRERLRELRSEPDAIDHLLAEVEESFESALTDGPPQRSRSLAVEGPREGLLSRLAGFGAADAAVHRVRTADGALFTGTWEEIVLRMRDTLSHPDETVAAFMERMAQRVRRLTGSELPCDTAEAFLRGSARVGLLRIEE